MRVTPLRFGLPVVAALLLTSALGADQGPRAIAAPIGSISVQVLVDGEDRSGGSFGIVVLPADYPQPVVSAEVEKYWVHTERGRAQVTDLEPGKYLVAIVLPPRLMRDVPPTSVEVVAPDWVRNSSGTTSGFWPAYEVEVSIEKPAASVTFVRVGYEPLPEGFQIPSASGSIQPPDTGSGGLRGP